MKHLFSAGLLAILIAALATAQDVAGEYIVELAGAPAAAATPVKSPRFSSGRSAVQAAQASVRSALAAANVQVTASVDTVMNALIVRTDDPARLGSTPGVARVYPVRLYKMVLDRAVILQNVPAAASLIGGAENAGAGVKIGIVDSGIDIAHPAFSDAGFTLPDSYPRVNKDTDNQFTNRKVIVARNYDTRVSSSASDRRGHGTAVAMIAAGGRNSGPKATIMGIAPKAYLGSYKVFPDGQDGAPNSQILKALDDAVADGMDIINLSLGAFPAERLDADPLVTAVENASRAGVIVVIAAGNEGPGLNTIDSPATAPSALSVGSSSTDRIFGLTAWLEGLDPFVAIPGDAPRDVNVVRAQLTDVSTMDPDGLACSALPEGSLSGKVALILRGTCFFEEKLNIASRAGAVGAIIYTHADRPAAEPMAAGTALLPAVMIGYSDGLKAKARLQSGDVEVVIDFSERAIPVVSAGLPNFTSKGPSVDNRLKPELVAIGTSVYTALPSVGYAALQGTSFSAPMVAGAAALLKAHRPGLSTEQYKSLLMNSTAQYMAALQEAGTGLLDVGAAARSTLTAVPSALHFGVGASTIDSTQTIVVKNLGTTSDTFSITTVPGTDVAPIVVPDVVELSPGASAEIAVRLTGTSLAAQAHEGFLVLRGTQTEVTTRIPYWYAVTDGNAHSIDIIEAPDEGRPASTQNFYVRALDGSGVPLQSEPKVTLISTGEGASVLSIQSVDDRYPGFHFVRVKLSTEPGPNTFEIEAGGVTRRVTITGS